MADTEQQVASNTDQQVTSKTPATKEKNPKRVAGGKAVAERTRIARESQRKAFIEAQSIITNNQPKPPSDPPETIKNVLTTTQWLASKNVLTTTQWLSIISIVVSLTGIYYKREEIKNLLTKNLLVKKLLTKKTDPPSPVLPRTPPPSPVLPRAPPARIRQMD